MIKVEDYFVKEYLLDYYMHIIYTKNGKKRKKNIDRENTFSESVFIFSKQISYNWVINLT